MKYIGFFITFLWFNMYAYYQSHDRDVTICKD